MDLVKEEPLGLPGVLTLFNPRPKKDILAQPKTVFPATERVVLCYSKGRPRDEFAFLLKT